MCLNYARRHLLEREAFVVVSRVGLAEHGEDGPGEKCQNQETGQRRLGEAAEVDPAPDGAHQQNQREPDGTADPCRPSKAEHDCDSSEGHGGAAQLSERVMAAAEVECEADRHERIHELREPRWMGADGATVTLEDVVAALKYLASERERCPGRILKYVHDPLGQRGCEQHRSNKLHVALVPNRVN